MNNGNGDHLTITRQSGLHVAIIMDGSGRLAEVRGLLRAEGHRAGRAAVRRVVAAALDRGIRVLTLFTFSTDNWGRPETEVAELMRTFEGFFRVDAPAFAAHGVGISVIGRRDRLPASLRDAIEKIEAASARAVQLRVRLAIDYSGRDAILHAARRFRHVSDDSAESFARLLADKEHDGEPAPDVDLLIRTGGEQRLSNCPLWEIAYAELYFTSCLWPDFGPAELDAALQDFSTRHRRFGRIPAVI
ncbi:MAG: polyprenyl diphosphate synthase [Terriglobia bacterium]